MPPPLRTWEYIPTYGGNTSCPAGVNYNQHRGQLHAYSDTTCSRGLQCLAAAGGFPMSAQPSDCSGNPILPALAAAAVQDVSRCAPDPDLASAQIALTGPTLTAGAAGNREKANDTLAADGVRSPGTTLKVRLSLIITALLTLVTIAG